MTKFRKKNQIKIYKIYLKMINKKMKKLFKKLILKNNKIFKNFKTKNRF